MPNSDSEQGEEEREQEEQLNIGTLFRYVLGEEDSALTWCRTSLCTRNWDSVLALSFRG